MPNVNSTTERGWPLPHPQNVPIEDVQRISAALVAADSAVTSLENDIGAKTNLRTQTKTNLVNAINELLSTVSTSVEIVKTLGLYIDDDGDLAQEDEEEEGENG